MKNRYMPLIVMLVLVISVQLITALTGTSFFLTQLTMTAYYTLVAVGLCILMGYAGQISLGHAGFFAIGGYTSAFLTTTNLLPYAHTPVIAAFRKAGVMVTTTDLYGATLITVHPWLAFVIALVIAAGVAVIIGIPVLRLKGHYLAMATLGFGIIIYRLVLGTSILGSADGISDVPAFAVLPGIKIGGAGADRIANYYFGWSVVLLSALLMQNLIHSRAGRALSAIHGNEPAARAMGIDTASAKLHLFIFSALLAAAAGALLTHNTGGIGPSEAGVMKSVRYVAIVAVGGMANLWGTIFASALLNFLSLRGYFGVYDDAVFGAILVFMMLVAPRGLLTRTTYERLLSFVRKKRNDR